ncbi:hypothetical protein [Luedemannella helvata]|uniref:Lipoprotein n=1 Tax=Luedemannella helvata TaxID=349315 RepID=A0ABN2KIU9_9ACTN
MTKRLLTGAALAAAVLLGATACADNGSTTTTTATSAATATSAPASAPAGDRQATCAKIKGTMDKAATEFLAAIVSAGSSEDPAAANKAAQSALQAYATAAETASTDAAGDPELKAALDNLQKVMFAKSSELASIKDAAGLEKALNDPALNKAVADIQALCPAS